jgi:hypothetical protein
VKLSATTGSTVTEWRERYEGLRAITVGTERLTGAPGLGLHLLLQYGVAGWMEKWAPTPTPVSRTEPVPALVPTPGQHDVAVLLAEMTLNCLTHHATTS